MIIESDRCGNFDLTPLTNMEIWSISFFVCNSDDKILKQTSIIRERDTLASTLFDFSLRCMSIDYMDYDRRSSHLAIVVVDDKSKNTNITLELVESLMKLDIGLL